MEARESYRVKNSSMSGVISRRVAGGERLHRSLFHPILRRGFLPNLVINVMRDDFRSEPSPAAGRIGVLPQRSLRLLVTLAGNHVVAGQLHRKKGGKVYRALHD